MTDFVSDPQSWGLIALIIIVVGAAIVVWRREAARNASKRKQEATKSYEERKAQSYSKAKREYDDARKAIHGQSHAPMVIDLIHDITDDQRASGVPQRIEFGEATKILDQINAADKDQEIEVVIHTLGGYSLAAELIASALKARTAPTKAHIPYIAMSGGTMVALACDEVCMGKNAALGPIDTQYYGYAGDSYERLKADKDLNEIADEVLLISYEVEKYERDANAKACAIMDDHHKPDGPTDCRVVDQLMSSRRPHSERVDYSVAKAMQMNVTDGCDALIYKFVNAKLQMIQKDDERFDED